MNSNSYRRSSHKWFFHFFFNFAAYDCKQTLVKPHRTAHSIVHWNFNEANSAHKIYLHFNSNDFLIGFGWSEFFLLFSSLSLDSISLMGFFSVSFFLFIFIDSIKLFFPKRFLCFKTKMYRQASLTHIISVDDEKYKIVKKMSA